MKKRTKMFIIVVPLVLLMVMVVVLVYSPRGAESAPLTCTRTTISDVDNANAFLTPNSDYAYYVEEVSGNDVIREYDFSSSSESTISGQGAEPYFEYLQSVVVNDDYVCWFDTRNSQGSTVDVYAYDISSSTEIRVTSSTYDIRDLCLVNDHVGFYNYSSGSEGFYICDLSASPISLINVTTNLGTMGASCGNATAQLVSGVEVFCFEWVATTPTWNLYMYDTGSSQITSVATSSNIERWPVIQNGVIYYQLVSSADSGGWDFYAATENAGYIKAYNLATSSTSTVLTYSADDWVYIVPNTNDANYLLYLYRDSSNSNALYLKAYNFSANSTTTIDTASLGTRLEAFSYSCYGNKVVYSMGSNSDLDTYVYDLSSSTSSTICDNGNSTCIARISDDKIIWTDISFASVSLEWDDVEEEYVFEETGSDSFELYYNTY